MAAVSSGWSCGYAHNGVDYDNTSYIYTPRHGGGRWYGRWVSRENYGTLAMLADYICSEANDGHYQAERLEVLEEVENEFWRQRVAMLRND